MDYRSQNIVAVTYNVIGGAQNRTVGSDKRKIHAQRVVKRGRNFFKHYIEKLYEDGYYQNKDNSTQARISRGRT